MIKFKMLKAEEYCDSVRDGTHDSPKKVKTGFKLITSKHIKEYGLDLDNAYYISEKDFKKVNERSAVDINDILYSMIGTIGLMYRVESKPNYAIKNMGLFKVSDETKSKWLYYYLKSPKMKSYIQSLLNGSTQQYITLSNLRQLPIELPENENDMKNIIRILDVIDKKIKLNVQTNDNLYEITNKLYEQLFVVERQDDWKEYNLQELMNISNGYSYTGKELVDTSVVGMATIKNFERTGGFKEEGFKDIEPIKAKDNHYADKFDILVACTDLTQNADIIGNAVMLLNTGKYEKVVISMDLVKILPKKNKYLVFSILNSKEFKNFALGYKTGTTVLHLNKNCFKDFNIKLPDLDKLEEFEKVVEVNYKKISSNLEENNTLTQLRDTLLPKLMNGEIDLDKIEI